MNKIRKGDEVVVIAGKDKGRRGTVLRVYADERVLVENVNVAKKHQKPKQDELAQTHNASFIVPASNLVVKDIADAGVSTERLSQDSKSMTMTMSNWKKQSHPYN